MAEINTLIVTLDEQQSAQLEQMASEHGLTSSELAARVLDAYLKGSDDVSSEFIDAVHKAIEKHQPLLNRLAES
ncbi:MAG: hypothetical protein IPM16_19495 [Chloroflexi bacterium]|nr:hypothetical protein [Chloroflexota bacterium]